MITPTPYAPATPAGEARAQELRLGRRASRTHGLVRAVMLAAALATLAFALNNALHAGSRQVADSLAGSTGGVSTQ